MGEVDVFLLNIIFFFPYDLVDDGSNSSGVAKGCMLWLVRFKRGYSVLMKYGIDIVH